MDDVIGQRAWNRLAAGRQCTATSKQTGERCKRAPIVGGFVCDMHGGATPAVKQSARERLLAMVDPALDALLRALQTRPPCEHCGRSDADRDPVVLRAAQLVLDRAGYHPTLGVVREAAHNPLSHLSLSELADRAEECARRARELADDEAAHLLPEVTEGFIVPEGDEPVVIDAAIQNDAQRNPVGNDTPNECKEDK